MKKILTLLALLWALPSLAQFSISQLPPATTPLNGTELFPCTQLGATKKCLTGSVIAASNAAFLLQSPNASLPLSRTLVGTANEILLADGGALGNLVLSTPQPIATTSDVTFHSLLLTVDLTVPNGGTGVSTLTGLVLGNGASAMSAYAGTSCTNQFVRALSLNGTATCNTVANTDLANSSFTLNGASVSLGGTRTLSLASADFVNQGTTTTVLHGNAAGNPAFSAVSLTTDVSNVLPSANGGTSFGTYTLGDILYSSATNTLAKLPGNITTTKNFLTQTGSGAVSAAPAWGTIAAADLPGAFSGFANPSGLIGLAAVNGVATTATRSDATHALDQSIAPTWSAQHIFSKAFTTSGTAGNYAVFLQSATPALALDATGAAADAKVWELTATNTDLLGRISNDAGSTTKLWLDVTRAANVVTAVALGNTTDKPPITLNGATTIPAPTTGSALTVTSVANSNAVTINTPATAGQSFGILATAGTNSADYNATFRDAGTNNILVLRGDRQVLMAGITATSAAQTGTVCWSATGGLLSIDTTVACLASTRKVKQNILPLESGIWELMKLAPVSYELRPEFDWGHAGKQIGLVAEDVAAVDPRLVALDDNGDPRGVRYMQMTALLVKSVQQQQYEIYALWAALVGSFAFTYFRTRKPRLAVDQRR